jgi:hypothetical protein
MSVIQYNDYVDAIGEQSDRPEAIRWKCMLTTTACCYLPPKNPKTLVWRLSNIRENPKYYVKNRKFLSRNFVPSKNNLENPKPFFCLILSKILQNPIRNWKSRTKKFSWSAYFSQQTWYCDRIPGHESRSWDIGHPTQLPIQVYLSRLKQLISSRT